MEKIKQSPILMGVCSCAGLAVLLLVVEFIVSLINSRPFGDQLREPVTLIIIIAGSIGNGVYYYFKTKKELAEKNSPKKER